MDVTKLLSIMLGAVLVNNFIFSQFLGICPFMGVSKKVDTAVGMGLAVTFVMGLASAICWPINEFLLVNKAIYGEGPNLSFMQTIVYILVIASLVQFVEMFLKKSVPSLYESLGIFLPLITTNCAVLGAVLLNTQNSYNFIESVVYGVTGGLGFLLAIFLFASVRERLEFSECPKSFEGFPIALVTAGLIALCFMGFSGLKVW
ncbi:MAG: electron transport complex protein RnfA [Oscillospiraceae bacterium]|nr:electron transport complex protein RnfA [Oscillospiraceae bacterium]